MIPAAISALVVLAVVGGLVVLGVKAWRGRERGEGEREVDLIPYLLMALAVGTAGFSLAALARASLTSDRLVGRPTGEIAGALAGLVVASPIAYLLWRRQARRRASFPAPPGWPIYLALVEGVFLIAFFIAVAGLGEVIAGDRASDWTDLVVYGGVVAFTWWAQRRDPPEGDLRELPQLTGSAVALVTLIIGLIGALGWIISVAFDGIWGLFRIPEPEVPLALTIAAAPIWAWRWLPGWDGESTTFRRIYLALVTSSTLIVTIGASVTLVATAISFLLGESGRAQEHFRLYPRALAALVVAGGFWRHHLSRLAPGRLDDRRGYEYIMAAAGLTSLIGAAVALVDAAFRPAVAGSPGTAIVTLGCTVIASGWVWRWFWRRAQAAPRAEEVGAPPRRVYLIGMAIVTGLTAAGSLIAVLVVIFRAVLGEVVGFDSLRVPLTLTITAGLAFWHLFNQVRTDGAVATKESTRPFSVTIICSHPGAVGTMFPPEARVRVLYRADSAGVIDDAMASSIVSSVDGRSSLVWVDDTGFRVAAARET